MFDAYGRQVPARLQPIFNGRRKMMEICRGLAALRRDLAAIGVEPYTRDLNIKEVDGLLETARVRITHAMPFEPCDCRNWEYDCPKCHGLRWTTVQSCLNANQPTWSLSDT